MDILRSTLCAAGLAVLGARSAQAADYWFYVAAESADEVYLVRFDGKEAKVEKRIEVGTIPTEIEGPHGLTVSLDGRHWFLSMAHGKPYGTLYKYETGTDELVGQCELGLFPATMQISPATGLLYCVNFDLHGDMTPSSVSIVDPDEMVEVARVTTGSMPHGSRVSPDGRFQYSCAMMTGELFELDAARFELTRVFDLDANTDATAKHVKPKAGATPKEAMDHAAGAKSSSKPTWVHPHPERPFAYVCLNGAAEVVELDLDAWRITRRFETGKGPYNAEVTPDGNKLVVTYKGSAEIGIWDLWTGKEIKRLPSSQKVTHGVVISPDSRYAFVSCEGIGAQKGTVDVIDLKHAARISTVEIGLQAGGICFWKTDGT